MEWRQDRLRRHAAAGKNCICVKNFCKYSFSRPVVGVLGLLVDIVTGGGGILQLGTGDLDAGGGGATTGLGTGDPLGVPVPDVATGGK